MKKTLVLAAAILAVTAPQAFADITPGWYVTGGVGPNWAEDSVGHSPSGNNTIEYDGGISYMAAGGYAWDDGLRAELEYFHERDNVRRVDGLGTKANGQLNNNDIFANGYYDFKTGTMWTPYVGAGVGVAFVRGDQMGTLANGGFVNGSATEFAYQGIVGVAAQIDRNWAITADYRYVRAIAPDINVTPAAGTSETHDAVHNIIFAIRYSFGAPVPPIMAAATPAPQPMPVEKPHVAPIPQSYMVFFDFDKSSLTPEAKRIIASAAQDFKANGHVRLVVTGHTDTMGSDKYNQGLSDRRAASVRAELERLGVEAKAVVTKGVGKSGLLVPTDDQVREAQNRRAEIVFSK